MKIGRFEVKVHNFGNFRLDGGAMFGSVPKNLWSKRIPADEENCIALATNSLIIFDGDKKILVDVGLGMKWDEKLKKIFSIQNSPPSALVDATTITDVILTHLHFDHAGGISYYADDGTLKLTYPKARIFLQKRNFENALNPSQRERASYLKENVRVLERADLHLLSGSAEIFPGIFVNEVDGHTAGQQYIEIKDDGVSLVYPTDVIPTSHHVSLPYTMGYDICTNTIMEEKEDLLKRAVKDKAIVVFEHDVSTTAATLKVDEKGQYAVDAVLKSPF